MFNAYHPRPWHRGSEYGDGTRRPLSADQRRAWLARADLERQTGCRTSRPTATHLLVGQALLKRLGEDGRCDPSHATLAEDVGCGEKTVRIALARLQGRGLLSWEKRIVRRDWPEGGPGAQRAEQTSNAYQFVLPGALVQGAARPAELRRSSLPRNQISSVKQEALVLPTIDQVAARQQLDAISTRRQAQLTERWQAERASRLVARAQGWRSP